MITCRAYCSPPQSAAAASQGAYSFEAGIPQRRVRSLLDTHAGVWWLLDDRECLRLSRSTIEDADAEVFDSAYQVRAGDQSRLGRCEAVREIAGGLRKCRGRAICTLFAIAEASPRGRSMPQSTATRRSNLAAQAALRIAPRNNRSGIQQFAAKRSGEAQFSAVTSALLLTVISRYPFTPPLRAFRLGRRSSSSLRNWPV